MDAAVKDVMTTQVIWVEQDTPFAAIAAALRQYRVSAFPVLNDRGEVIGVVSESDLLAKQALGGGDGEMPGMITGILLPESDGDPAAFDASVIDGVVTLTGRPRTREQGREITSRARHVQGVVAVRDRLEYPPQAPPRFDVLASFPID